MARYRRGEKLSCRVKRRLPRLPDAARARSPPGRPATSPDGTRRVGRADVVVHQRPLTVSGQPLGPGAGHSAPSGPFVQPDGRPAVIDDVEHETPTMTGGIPGALVQQPCG